MNLNGERRMHRQILSKKRGGKKHRENRKKKVDFVDSNNSSISCFHLNDVREGISSSTWLRSCCCRKVRFMSCCGIRRLHHLKMRLFVFMITIFLTRACCRDNNMGRIAVAIVGEDAFATRKVRLVAITSR